MSKQQKPRDMLLRIVRVAEILVCAEIPGGNKKSKATQSPVERKSWQKTQS